MKKPVNKIEKLIAKMCPDGVEFKELGEICLSISAGGDLPKKYQKGQSAPRRVPLPYILQPFQGGNIVRLRRNII